MGRYNRRSQTAMPVQLKDLRHDPATMLYYRTEAGITYTMPLEMTRKLRVYYVYFHMGTEEGTQKLPSMERWYSDLKKEDKAQVVRTGNIPPEKTDFFPDTEYPDA